MDRAAAQRAYRNSGDFTGWRAEDQAAAERLAADGDQLGYTAAGAEDARRVPAANEFVYEGMVTLERQFVIEDAVENVRAVEERRPIVEMGIEAGGVVFRIVLNGADGIKRF